MCEKCYWIRSKKFKHLEELMDDTRSRAVAVCCAWAERDSNFTATTMAEIALGVIAVEDFSGDCYALFDVDLWRFDDKSVAICKCPILQLYKLDVLAEMEVPGEITNISEMLVFAKARLVSTGRRFGRSPWYGEPRYFPHLRY